MIRLSLTCKKKFRGYPQGRMAQSNDDRENGAVEFVFCCFRCISLSLFYYVSSFRGAEQSSGMKKGAGRQKNPSSISSAIIAVPPQYFSQQHPIDPNLIDHHTCTCNQSPLGTVVREFLTDNK